MNARTPTSPSPARGSRRAPRRLVWAALATALLFALPAGAAGNRAEKAAKLKQLKQEIRSLTARIAAARGQAGRLNDALRQAEQGVARVARDLRLLDARLRRAESRLDGIEARQVGARARLDGERDVLRQQLRSAYAMGRQSAVKLLLNQEDPATFGRLMVYNEYLGRARSAQIERVQTEVAKLQTLREQARAQRDEIAGLKQHQEAKQAELAAERGKRATALAQVRREISQGDRKLVDLRKNETQLESLLRALDQALADIPDQPELPFRRLRGKLAWPAAGHLLARYGSARGVGNLRWRGVLIGAPTGAPVRAVAGGRIAFAHWLRGFGLLIIVDHGDGYMSLYGHNQSLLKDTGDWVQAGDTIATVGDSGGQEHSALYFEIRHNGRPVNPARWCRRGGRGGVG